MTAVLAQLFKEKKSRCLRHLIFLFSIGSFAKINAMSSEPAESSFDELITLDYVRHKAAEMSPTDMVYVSENLPAVSKALENTAFDSVRNKAERMVQIIEEISAGQPVKISYPSLAVAVFGLNYLLKKVDIIPDQIPEDGYKDDAIVLARCAEQMGRELKHWKVSDSST